MSPENDRNGEVVILHRVCPSTEATRASTNNSQLLFTTTVLIMGRSYTSLSGLADCFGTKHLLH